MPESAREERKDQLAPDSPEGSQTSGRVRLTKALLGSQAELFDDRGGQFIDFFQ